MIDKESFIEEARFAKVVETADGPALLIAGQVINITSANKEHASWLASALRGRREDCFTAAPSLASNVIGSA